MDELVMEIRLHFAGVVSFAFYSDYVTGAVGLEVHVRTKNRKADVKKYCRWLERNPPSDVPVKIRVT
jgi:hypothetical protein